MTDLRVRKIWLIFNGNKRLVLLSVLLLLIIGLPATAQIDSRNQTKSRNQPVDRAVGGERIKPRKQKNKKVKSNRRQVKNSRRSFKKQGDVGYKGSITGQKQRTKRTNRQTVARPAPDPYAKRRIRTEADRSSPRPPRPITATKKGERARSGDISGQKRVRQKSTRSARSVTYPSTSPYTSRKIKTEKDRAYSNKKQRRNIRSQTRVAESSPPRKASAPITSSGGGKITRRKNAYRNHERRKGETSSNRDIAGKKLKKKNYRSDPPSQGARSVGVNPYSKGKRYGEGERFSGFKGSGVARSTRQPGERTTSKNLRGRRSQPYRNYRSSRPKSSYQAKSVRSTARPYGGETARFGKSRSAPVRSNSGKPRKKSTYRSKPGPLSVSGGGRLHKQKNTYREKDKRFAGENASDRDIAGRKLRTRNYRSQRPVFSGLKTYSGGSASRQSASKYKSKPVRSITKTSPGNYQPKGIRSASRTSPGNYRAKPIRSASRTRPGKYQAKPIRSASRTSPGNYRAKPIRSATRTGPGNYQAKPIRSASRNAPGNYQAKPIRSSNRAGWNNNATPLQKRDRGANARASTFRGKSSINIIPSYSDIGVGNYAGRTKARKPLKGGGSISTQWNNDGLPLQKKSRGSNANASIFVGKQKAKKPLKGGGGSISTLWNNNGQPLQKKSRGANAEASIFAGKGKAKKPLKGGGGSITTQWNNDGQPLRREQPDNSVSSFLGKQELKEKSRSQAKGTEYGTVKKMAFLSFGEEGGRMVKPSDHKNENINKIQPRVKRRDIEQSKGTELGRRKSLAFLKIGQPDKAGLVSKYNGSGKPSKNDTAEGLDRGRVKTLSFWAYGNPTKGGFEKHPTMAKGRMHSSSRYVNKQKNLNSVEEKDKTFKFRIWWAKVFKKNENQPDAAKEEKRKPRYDKGEREIWETQERVDWYK